MPRGPFASTAGVGRAEPPWNALNRCDEDVTGRDARYESWRASLVDDGATDARVWSVSSVARARRREGARARATVDDARWSPRVVVVSRRARPRAERRARAFGLASRRRRRVAPSVDAASRAFAMRADGDAENDAETARLGVGVVTASEARARSKTWWFGLALAQLCALVNAISAAASTALERSNVTLPAWQTFLAYAFIGVTFGPMFYARVRA